MIEQMKIAHVNMFFYPTIGGVEQVMLELAKRQVKAGHEVHVYCCDSDKYKRIELKEEVVEGIHIHRLSYWCRLSLNTFVWPSLIWKLDKKFDIIHSHVSGHDYILFAGLLAKLKHAKHIHTTHCPWTDSSFRPWILRPFLFINDLFMNKLAFKFVDKIVYEHGFLQLVLPLTQFYYAYQNHNNRHELRAQLLPVSLQALA